MGCCFLVVLNEMSYSDEMDGYSDELMSLESMVSVV